MNVGIADVMDTVGHAVSFIKKSDLQSPIFTSPCQTAGEVHNAVLYHSEFDGLLMDRQWHA